jgi:hypothetical protein
MPVDRLLRERHVLGERVFVDVAVWRVPQPVPGSRHSFKYRLALVVSGECILRYDNETGKSDHRHVGRREEPYFFQGFERLLADFWAEVEALRAADWRIEHDDGDA